jgi:hypothetical protein
MLQSALTISSEIPGDVEEFFQHWQGIANIGYVPGLRSFLDARPFKLQSEVAIVDVVSATEMRFRLFGTGLSTIAGHDLTGSDVLSNFHTAARAKASRNAWSAITQPCGYVVQRDIHHGAFDSRAIGIGLPLLHEQSGRICLVTFSSVLDKTKGAHQGDDSPLVRNVHLLRWIDIGAGTPEA